MTPTELDLQRRLDRAYLALSAGTRAFAFGTGAEMQAWIATYGDVLDDAVRRKSESRAAS
ncbi:hypothetical protein [Aureimonas glaciei]|uniref:Uncharacterized protein n=1 Tax=Aureimonas glaciei TaxID=1776957 RepID=A0A916Y2X6_9HYPH|nr:hypothetical protein [Aureimonas glaciei]GGD28876.1 hypothetical protein GCM10011335_35060 [Aureimonas glaciei]